MLVLINTHLSSRNLNIIRFATCVIHLSCLDAEIFYLLPNTYKHIISYHRMDNKCSHIVLVISTVIV